MVDNHNKIISEIISSINNDELRKYMDDFNSLEVARIMDYKLKAENAFHEIVQKYKEKEADQKTFLEHKYDSSDTSLIDSLTLQIDSLKAIIQCQDLEIGLLKFQIESYDNVDKISEIADKLSDATMDQQERMIEYQTAKVDKYKKGPKKKAADSQQKWALANEYFKEEITAHRTLKAARLAAAKKAGIVAEQRQLTKMMPNPR